MRDGVLYDEQLGELSVKVNPRARHIIMRARESGVLITIPVGVSEKEVLAAVDKFRERLESNQEKQQKKRIDLDYQIKTEYFTLTLQQGGSEKFIARSTPGRLDIVCPPTADFDDENLQVWLCKVIEEALKKNAKIILPQRLALLSKESGLPFRQVKVNSSKGRWGSCSALKDINLSYYTLLLPGHLMNYVLLHELCHTREMNHGERFWQLLDKHTSGKALTLRSELRKYRTEIF